MAVTAAISLAATDPQASPSARAGIVTALTAEEA